METKTNAEQICKSFVAIAANYSRELRILEKDYKSFLNYILKEADKLPERVKAKIISKIKKLEGIDE